MSKSQSPQIEFAKRHIVSRISTFNTASVLDRLDIIMDDIEEAKKYLDPVLEGRFYPAFFEFTSYYQVGFVTCMEWHAKSRLFDLLSHFPKLISAEDFKQSQSHPKILSMASEELTVPHVIASSINVTTFEKYISIFSRVLEEIGAKDKINEILDQTDEDGNQYRRVIGQMYEIRNELVHEISLTDIGHFNIRSFLSFDNAENIGKVVKNLVRSIEAEITKLAPSNFPNILDENFFPVSKHKILQGNIVKMEEEIRRIIAESEGLFFIKTSKWDENVEFSRKQIESEIELIREMELPGQKYFDSREVTIEKLLEGRILYLEEFHGSVRY